MGHEEGGGIVVSLHREVCDGVASNAETRCSGGGCYLFSGAVPYTDTAIVSLI